MIYLKFCYFNFVYSFETMDESCSIRTVYSQKGKLNLVYQNFQYKSYRFMKSTEEQGWICARNKCVAKRFTLGDVTTFSRVEGCHNHDPISEQALNRKSISNAIKRKATEVIDERPTKLIHKEIENQTEAVNTLTTKDIIYIRNNITHARLKSLPKLPKSSREVQEALKKIVMKTIKNEEFLLKNDVNNGLVMFSCDSNLKYLCERDIILMDGTFEYAPKYFTQLFTIHGYCDGSYTPLVFFLLKDKKKQTYCDIFGILKEECGKRQLCFNPKIVVVDFEHAIHEGVRLAFPGIKLVGCRFHLAQSW